MCAACMHVICHDRRCHMMCNYEGLRDKLLHAEVCREQLTSLLARTVRSLRGIPIGSGTVGRDTLEEILLVWLMFRPSHDLGHARVTVSLPIPPSPHPPDILQLDRDTRQRDRGRLQRPFTCLMNGEMRCGQIEVHPDGTILVCTKNPALCVPGRRDPSMGSD